MQSPRQPIMKPKPRSQHRLSLDVTKRFRNSLSALQDELGARTLTEALRRAVEITSLFARHRHSGGKLILRSRDGSEETLKVI